MKFERLSDTEVREFLRDARALRNAYLAELVRSGARKVRDGLGSVWHSVHDAHPAALLKPASRRRDVDIDQFVVR